jgi:hypothetical protein
MIILDDNFIDKIQKLINTAKELIDKTHPTLEEFKRLGYLISTLEIDIQDIERDISGEVILPPEM